MTYYMVKLNGCWFYNTNPNNLKTLTQHPAAETSVIEINQHPAEFYYPTMSYPSFIPSSTTPNGPKYKVNPPSTRPVSDKPVYLYLQVSKVAVVQYQFSTNKSLYYIKVLTSGGLGYVLDTKFTNKAEARALCDKINRVRRIDLRHWSVIARPQADFLHSRKADPEIYRRLQKLGYVK
jgi:hypothetical protein